MLAHSPAFSGFAVDDVPVARQFYQEVLGLPVTEDHGMLRLHLHTGADVLVYPKLVHTPASFTILNFPVPDIEETVAALTTRGVIFEHYAGTPGETDDMGIFRKGGPLIAWFTDPAGNVLSLIQQ